MKSALIVYGGWEVHQPKEVSQLLHDVLVNDDFRVELSDTLDAFLDGDKLKSLDLIVPIWTMGTIKREQLNPLLEAVRSGVGIAGCHGGMCDAFRVARPRRRLGWPGNTRPPWRTMGRAP